MHVYCPECGSHEFVLFNGGYLCCNCSREFGPKCPDCGTEMDPHGKVWICSGCQREVEFSEIELPKVESEVYMRAFRNARSRKSNTSSGGGQSFLGFLWETFCNSVTDMMNSSKK